MSTTPYDPNFCYPLPDTLENARVALVPFIPEKHGQLFIEQALLHLEIYTHLPFGPFADLDDLKNNFLATRVQPAAGNVLFAVFDKTRAGAAAGAHDSDSDSPADSAPSGAFAGIIGLFDTSPANLVTEIACVVILPPFQRTHVASTAVGLLLHFALDAPAPGGASQSSDGPLALRRVVWKANERNAPSIRLAQRLGFVLEGVLRWERVLPPWKTASGNGVALREGDPRAGCPGRNTAILGMTWDEWEGEWRDKVDAIMARVY